MTLNMRKENARLREMDRIEKAVRVDLNVCMKCAQHKGVIDGVVKCNTNDIIAAVIISMNPFGGSKSVRCPQLIHLIEKQRRQNL